MAKSHDRASDLHARPSVKTVQPDAPGPAITPAAPPVCGEQGFDPLSDVLHMVKLTGALFFMVDASSPWAVEVPRVDEFAGIVLPRAQHIISYHLVLHGAGWASIPDVGSVRFEAGDILAFPLGDACSMLSAPDQLTEFDRAATLQFFRDMAAGKLPFVVEEGGGGAERTQFVCGYLGCDIRPFNPLLLTLPRLLHLKRPKDAPDALLERLIELTLAEARILRTGGGCIRLRLSELMFIELIRLYVESLPAGQSGWLSGLADPSSTGRRLARGVGGALRALRWMSANAIPDIVAHADGCPTHRRRRDEGFRRCKGGGLRLGGCLQPCFQEGDRRCACRMAASLRALRRRHQFRSITT